MLVRWARGFAAITTAVGDLSGLSRLYHEFFELRCSRPNHQRARTAWSQSRFCNSLFNRQPQAEIPIARRQRNFKKRVSANATAVKDRAAFCERSFSSNYATRSARRF